MNPSGDSQATPDLRGEQLQKTLEASDLVCAYYEVHNDSHLHSRGTQSHYRILVIAEEFEGLTRVRRQQRVHQALRESMQGLYSLTLQTLSESEWTRAGYPSANAATPCLRKKAN